MDGSLLDEVKAQLDSELAQADDHVGIAFGDELFAAFAQRGWIVPKDSYALGVMRLPFQLPAYETHYAFVHWELEPTAYLVGKRS